MKSQSLRIGIIGTGDLGKTLEGALVKAGHKVILGHRNPAVQEENGVRKNSFLEAAEQSEILIVAIPGQYAVETLTAFPASATKNKIIIDISVGLTPDFSDITFKDESGGELLQQALPASKIVKTLCTMTSSIMVNPAVLGEETNVFLSGNDADTKRVVSGILSDLGWSEASQMDLGGIYTAKAQEHIAFMYFALLDFHGHGVFNLRVVGNPSPQQ